MHRVSPIFLLASNDAALRTACANYFAEEGLVCRCIDFDEKLLGEVGKRAPAVFVADLSLREPHFSSDDPDSAFGLLFAVRHKFPRLPVFTLHAGDDEKFAQRSKELRFAGHFSGPPDYKTIFRTLRAARQRLVRLERTRRSREAARSAAGKPKRMIPFSAAEGEPTPGILKAHAAQYEKTAQYAGFLLRATAPHSELRGRPQNLRTANK